MPEKELILTYEGLQKLEEELEYSKTTKKMEVAERIKEARGFGDLSENSEYDAAKNEQAEVEGKIKELEAMLEHVVVIQGGQTDKVSIGTKVKIKYVEDDEIEEYSIVGSKEADPFQNKISNESPIARAIMGRSVNEQVWVESPNGNIK